MVLPTSSCCGGARKSPSTTWPLLLLGLAAIALLLRALVFPAATEPSEDMHSSPQAAVTAHCVDLKPGCSEWAAEHQCRTNPQFMHHFCGASCKVCNDLTVGGAGAWTPHWIACRAPRSASRVNLAPPSLWGEGADGGLCQPTARKHGRAQSCQGGREASGRDASGRDASGRAATICRAAAGRGLRGPAHELRGLDGRGRVREEPLVHEAELYTELSRVDEGMFRCT